MVINNGVHDGCSYNLDVCWVSLEIYIVNVTTAVTAHQGLKARLLYTQQPSGSWLADARVTCDSGYNYLYLHIVMMQ